MTFEWDTNKDTLNKQIHGISFDTALLVFNDLNRIEIPDNEGFFKTREVLKKQP